MSTKNHAELVSEIAIESWNLSELQIATLREFNETPGASNAIVDIHKSLNILFEDEQQADNWVHRPNQYFEGKSALEVMLKGWVGIKSVQAYLKSQIY